MRKHIHALAASLIVLSVPMAGGAAELLDRVVAIVNDEVVLMSELRNEVVQIRAQLQQSSTRMPSDDVLQQQVLERLVMKKIQLQKAREVGIRVSEDMLNQALSGIAQRNGISLNDMPEVLAQQGIDYAQYRDSLREEMIIEQLRRQEVEARIRVSDTEIQNFMERQGNRDDGSEYRLAHILVSLPAAADPERIQGTRAEAEELVRRARSGEDFAQLAIAESDGQSALQGGDLGWRTRDQIPSVFAALVTGMSVGDVSDPIRSPSGFHVFKLMDRRGKEARIVTQTHARHILIQPTEVMSAEEAEAELASLRRRIESGEMDFAEAARVNSDDPVSASKGGDLGWTNPGSFVPSFEEKLAELEPGEISEPFQTQFGWHIVELLERRQHDGTDEARRNQAYSALQQQKLEEQSQLWSRQLRDEAYVEYLL